MYKNKLTKKQKLYNKQFGVPKKNGTPKQSPAIYQNLEKNPVIDFGLKASGGEFYTPAGGHYKPGNPMYEKYNGEYHIHLNGEICAGKHKIQLMNPHNMLTPIDQPDFVNGIRKNRINKRWQNQSKPKDFGRFGFPRSNYAKSKNLPNKGKPYVFKKKTRK